MNRPGVSLTEVLVASVLLAVGIGGTLGALSTAVRFRSGAAAREAIAATAHDRLGWFDATACLVPDTTIERPLPGTNARESWTLVHDSSGAHLAGSVRGRAVGVTVGLSLDARRRCD